MIHKILGDELAEYIRGRGYKIVVTETNTYVIIKIWYGLSSIMITVGGGQVEIDTETATTVFDLNDPVSLDQIYRVLNELLT